MKQLFAMLTLCTGLFAGAAQAATEFVEGKHYEVVAEKATSSPVVTEYFSFYCGHCYHFEPIANKLAESLPAGVKFEKSHVDFLQRSSPEVQNAIARAYLVGANAGKGKEVAAMIFSYIHQQKANFGSESDIRSLLLVNDFDAATFDQGFNSMPVLAAASKMKEQQTYWTEKNVLTGVPMLMVNGKYKIKFDGLDPEQFDKQLAELVSYLATQK